MKKTIIGAATLVLFAGMFGTSASAMSPTEGKPSHDQLKMIKNRSQNRMQKIDLSEDQRAELKELRESKDFDALKDKLKDLGISKKIGSEFGKNLTEEQRTELKELRESGDKDALLEKMKEYGIDIEKKMGNKFGIELSESEREELKELRESGDFDDVLEKLSEFGVSADVIEKIEEKKDSMLERKEIINDILSDEDKEKLDEAKELLKEGDRKEAHDLRKEVFQDNKEELQESGLVKGFKKTFKKVGHFFKGLFK